MNFTFSYYSLKKNKGYKSFVFRHKISVTIARYFHKYLILNPDTYTFRVVNFKFSITFYYYRPIFNIDNGFDSWYPHIFDLHRIFYCLPTGFYSVFWSYAPRANLGASLRPGCKLEALIFSNILKTKHDNYFPGL